MPPAKTLKNRLTIGQLAAYDDILTDALVDHTFYWTTVPKNRLGYHASRGLKEDQITKLIQKHIIVNKDVQAAEDQLLATSLNKFYNGLRTDKEKDDFKKHLRRYTSMYLPDCPFEVNATNRYTITTFEAAISARRFIRKGEQIKHLTGIQVVISPEEERDIMAHKKDFSIVVSARNKCASLFMGPARFANHDCNANGRLVTCGHAGIEVVADRDIEIGEEITVTYSENYFGEDNCECLCKSCEDQGINGWSVGEGNVVVKKSIEDESSDGYSLRRRRRDESTGPGSRTPSVAPEIRPRIRKTRSRALLSGTDRASTTDSAAPESLLRQKRKREIDTTFLSSPPVTPAKRLKSADRSYAVSPIRPTSTRSRGSSADSMPNSTTDGENSGAVLTDVTSLDDEACDQILKTPGPTPGKSVPADDDDQELPTLQFFTPKETNDQLLPSIETPTHPAPRGFSPPPATQEPMEVDEEETTPTQVKNRKKWARRGPQRDPTPPPRERIPGDYTLTPLLLSQPETAWVTCTVCAEAFVQQNAYYTRRECPRCERHSKLYGYQWPKTDRAGKNDTEERILDHRTVHRFLDAEDERMVRGRNRADFKSLHAEWEKTVEPEEEKKEEEKKGGELKKRRVVRPKKPERRKPGPKPGTISRRKSVKHLKTEDDDDEDYTPEDDGSVVKGMRRSARARRASAQF